MNYTKKIFQFCFFFLVYVQSSQSQESAKAGIGFLVRLEKQEFLVGDDIQMEVVLKNHRASPLKLPDPTLAGLHYKVYDEQQGEAKCLIWSSAFLGSPCIEFEPGEEYVRPFPLHCGDLIASNVPGLYFLAGSYRIEVSYEVNCENIPVKFEQTLRFKVKEPKGEENSVWEAVKSIKKTAFTTGDYEKQSSELYALWKKHRGGPYGRRLYIELMASPIGLLVSKELLSIDDIVSEAANMFKETYLAETIWHDMVSSRNRASSRKVKYSNLVEKSIKDVRQGFGGTKLSVYAERELRRLKKNK